MRPIDADVLKQHIDKLPALPDGNFAGNHSALKALINMQPTIQPEVLACGNGELVTQPEPTDIDAKEAVYNLAEKIGIHQLFALTVELRGEPIQPEPKEGEWVQIQRCVGDTQPDLECPFCKHRIGWFDMGRYCAGCGAKLEGGAG